MSGTKQPSAGSRRYSVDTVPRSQESGSRLVFSVSRSYSISVRSTVPRVGSIQKRPRAGTSLLQRSWTSVGLDFSSNATSAVGESGDRARALPLEGEPRLVLLSQEEEAEGRDVHVPVGVAHVEAGALVQDRLRLLEVRGLRREEELLEPPLAVAHLLAVHLVHVAERSPGQRPGQADEDEVRPQRPDDLSFDDPRVGPPLPVNLLGHEVAERVLVLADVPARPLEDRREWGRDALPVLDRAGAGGWRGHGGQRLRPRPLAA